MFYTAQGLPTRDDVTQPLVLPQILHPSGVGGPQGGQVTTH